MDYSLPLHSPSSSSSLLLSIHTNSTHLPLIATELTTFCSGDFSTSLEMIGGEKHTVIAYYDLLFIKELIYFFCAFLGICAIA